MWMGAEAANPDHRERRITQCNFCGRHNTITGPMAEGPNGVYICFDCTEIAYGMLLELRARHRVDASKKTHPADPKKPN